jgi:type II secretory pathway predicted ATPase ExeA
MLDVYRTVYKLDREPFRLSPDYHFSFEHQTYNDAKSYIKYAINQGEGIVVITGVPGTGKTTLIASLISELNQSKLNIGVLSNLQLGAGCMIEMVADAFSLPIDCSEKVNMIKAFTHFLKQQHNAGKRTILIVDEAQGLSHELLEELRLLSNLQHNTQLLMQVFLVGQNLLMDNIRSPGLEQLHQRIIASAQLKPLDIEQTKNYIIHRLSCADWKGDPQLTDEVYNLVHKFSDGVPRLINLICHRLFLHAGLKNKHELIGADALIVIVELHKEGLLTSAARHTLGEYVGSIKDIANN